MENLNELKNKDFAFQCIKMLTSEVKINSNLISNLCDINFCNHEFFCAFPMLAEVPLYGEIPFEYYKDHAGHRRYYPERVFLENKAYLITNHWYGPNKKQRDNRTPFMNWVIVKLR